MPRPPLPIGTHGAVNTRALVDGTWYPKQKIPDGAKPTQWSASTRFRDTDGSTNPVKRGGASETKAKTALEKACAERSGSKPKLPPHTKFKDVAALWIAKQQTAQKGTTYDTKRRWLTGVVLPALGELRVRECTTTVLQDFFDDLATDDRPGTGEPLSAGSRRGIRAVVSGVLQYAVARTDLLATNPVRELESIKGGPRKKPRAFDQKQAAEFFAKVDADKWARRGQLSQLLRFMFYTGVRAGEVLAIRWQELNLTSAPVVVSDPVAGDLEVPPHSVWISGNIVRVTGQGLLRHEGKTDASQGIVGLPSTLVMMLLVQRPPSAGDHEPVFPSTTGGWRDPNTLQASIRKLCDRIGVEGFTSHVARKTYATALDRAGQSAGQITAALRKTDVDNTQEVYVALRASNPEAAGLIDSFYRQG